MTNQTADGAISAYTSHQGHFRIAPIVAARNIPTSAAIDCLALPSRFPEGNLSVSQ
jgi:hypothetical protein